DRHGDGHQSGSRIHDEIRKAPDRETSCRASSGGPKSGTEVSVPAAVTASGGSTEWRFGTRSGESKTAEVNTPVCIAVPTISCAVGSFPSVNALQGMNSIPGSISNRPTALTPEINARRTQGKSSHSKYCCKSA